ncbi:unnamed protein product [Candida verbasci]|uniref:Sulfhydryl oxidase n=1 Tax=Candida verbasci TaxID=1227364 RepID=A0A9W4TU33_9ASCO|nr:unnamed protein product [Candida verbasci]
MSNTTTTTTKTTDKDSNDNKPVIGLSGRNIVYDKDGKPCRTCNTLLDFQFAMGKKPVIPHEPKEVKKEKLSGYTKDYPPDVSELGKSSWTLLHSIAATYPENPTDQQQKDLKQFINLFSGFYPCWYCGEDFKIYIKKNEIETKNQDLFGKWLCNAHNEVNKKLNKPVFNCELWKKRWKDGWDEEE